MTTDLPLVSILCVTYNHEKYIAQAIESWLMQDVDFDIEIVIGEDCSTDDTRSIVKRFSEKHPDKINIVCRDKNVGAANNFLDCLSQCKGKYIALCEGDDYWISSDKIQRQADFLEKNNDFAICFHPVLNRIEAESKIFKETIVEESSEVSDIYQLAQGNYIHTPSIMFRNVFLSGVPDDFSYCLKSVTAGDYFISMFCALHGKIKKINECMAVYRIHSNGIWSSRSELQRYKEWAEALKLMTNYYPQDVVNVLEKQRLKILSFAKAIEG